MKRFLLLTICLIISNAPSSFAQIDEAASDDPQNVSINMPGAQISEVLRMLGRLSGMNLAIDPEVSGAVDLFWEDVPLEDAWKSILDSANLAISRDGGVTRVRPAGAEAAPVEPIDVRVIDLAHISLNPLRPSEGLDRSSQTQTANRFTGDVQSQQEDEQEIDQLIQEAFGDGITVVKVTRSNQLIVSGPASLLDQAEALIKQIDRPTRQVLLEAEVIQVRRQAMQDLGIDWGGVYTFQNTGAFTLSSDRQSDDPGGTSNSSLESISFSGTLGQFNVTLSALIDQGDARILFKPRVVTQSNREAFISSGQEIQIPSGLDINGNATFRERDVVLELSVTPQIFADGKISMGIRVRNDSINFAQPDISGVPPLDINTVESYVTVMNRDTVVVGGILSSQNSTTERRVPLLSDIPGLGRIFRSDSDRFEQAELLIAITPVIISDENGSIDYGSSARVRATELQQRAIDEMAEDRIWNAENDTERPSGSKTRTIDFN